MKISKDVIFAFHQELILRFGGIVGLRDGNVLDYILNIPEQTINQQQSYPTPMDKASIVAYLLISRHPFFDGNKRIGMHVLAVYLRYYGYRYEPRIDDVVQIALLVASGDVAYQTFCDWVRSTCK